MVRSYDRHNSIAGFIFYQVVAGGDAVSFELYEMDIVIMLILYLSASS